MGKQVLHTGQSDIKLVVRVDYEDGGQISLMELDNAQSVVIEYAYKDYDGENIVQDSWEVDGWDLDSDGVPNIYYKFKAGDVIPEDVNLFAGRAKIIDVDGFISFGREFSIQVLDSNL